MTALLTLAPPPVWVFWDHNQPGTRPLLDDRGDDLNRHPEPAWLEEVGQRVRRRLAQCRQPPVARGSFRIRTSEARLFIEAYARGRALSREEWAALPVMVAMHVPPNARYHRYCQQQRGEDIKARLRREVGTMRALRAEMGRIGPMLHQV